MNNIRETQRKEKSNKLLGNKTFDSLIMMIKYDRKETNIKEQEYFSGIKKKTEMLNEVYRTKYVELEDIFSIYSELSMKSRIVSIKTNNKYNN